jgi:hypothetical protein
VTLCGKGWKCQEKNLRGTCEKPGSSKKVPITGEKIIWYLKQWAAAIEQSVNTLISMKTA